MFNIYIFESAQSMFKHVKSRIIVQLRQTYKEYGTVFPWSKITSIAARQLSGVLGIGIFAVRSLVYSPGQFFFMLDASHLVYALPKAEISV